MRRMVATGLIFAAIVGGLWWNQDRGLKAVATQTHDALCAFKTDLERRSRATEEFIDDVKHGRRPPIQGVSLADLRRSLDTQRSTLQALKTLDCN